MLETFYWKKIAVHLVTHKLEDSYKWKQCKKMFSQKQSLSKHLKIHTPKKTHMCENYGKSFSRENNGNIHLRNHTEKDLINVNTVYFYMQILCQIFELEK